MIYTSRETTPLKFHKFIWYFWQPISLLGAVYNAWDAIAEWIGYLSASAVFAQILVVTLGCLIEFALVLAPILIFLGFFRWKPYAWFILMFLSLSNVICTPLLLVFNLSNYDIATILGKCSGVGLDIIILLYYWHRRRLFSVNILTLSPSYTKNPEVAKQVQYYCHKCGNKLIPNSAFCHKCGTRILEELER